MTSELEVDAAAVRAWAAALSGTAARFSPVAPPPTPGQRWTATAAELAVAAAAQVQLRRLVEDITAAARQVSAAADDYEDADDRAAARLRRTVR